MLSLRVIDLIVALKCVKNPNAVVALSVDGFTYSPFATVIDETKPDNSRNEIGLALLTLIPNSDVAEFLKRDTEKVWMRVGDGSNYNSFDNLELAAEFFSRHESGKISGWVPGGFVSTGYKGYNYVSLYFGDDDGNLTRTLDQKAQRAFKLAFNQQRTAI